VVKHYKTAENLTSAEEFGDLYVLKSGASIRYDLGDLEMYQIDRPLFVIFESNNMGANYSALF